MEIRLRKLKTPNLALYSFILLEKITSSPQVTEGTK